jgi:hypothetical protein
MGELGEAHMKLGHILLGVVGVRAVRDANGLSAHKGSRLP